MIESVILGVIAMLCYGSVEIFLKKVVERLGAYTTIFYRGLFITMFLILFTLFNQDSFVISAQIILWMLPVAAFGLLAFFSFTYAVKMGKLSLISPVSHSAAVVTVLLATLFLQEPLSLFQGFSILMIILGTLFVSFKWRELKSLKLHHFTKGVPYAILALFAWGITMFLLKISIDKFGALTPSVLLDSFMFLFLLLGTPFVTLKKPTRLEWKHLFMIGLLSSLAIIPSGYAFFYGLASVVTPIVYASPFVTVLLAKIFLDEHVEINQYAGIAVILLGIVLLAF